MVVIKENSESENGTIHKINCLMYVQPSVEDDRLTDSEKKISNYIMLHAVK